MTQLYIKPIRIFTEHAYATTTKDDFILSVNITDNIKNQIHSFLTKLEKALYPNGGGFYHNHIVIETKSYYINVNDGKLIVSREKYLCKDSKTIEIPENLNIETDLYIV